MRNYVDLIKYEAKAKPAIKALVDRAVDLTDQEIDAAVVPLPWYRQALRMLRQQERQKRDGDAIVNATWGFTEDPEGELAYFNLPTCFVKVSASGAIEVKEGYPIFFPKKGGVWIDTVFCSTIPTEMVNLLRTGTTTRSGYKQVILQRLSKLI